jgi:hypothetical protein
MVKELLLTEQLETAIAVTEDFYAIALEASCVSKDEFDSFSRVAANQAILNELKSIHNL